MVAIPRLSAPTIHDLNDDGVVEYPGFFPDIPLRFIKPRMTSGWFQFPVDSWATPDTSHPVSAAVVMALKNKRQGNYRETPYYYHQRELDFNVVYYMGDGSPEFLKTIDFDKEAVAFNETVDSRKPGVRDYFIRQSYGRLVPTFHIYNKVILFDESIEVPWFDPARDSSEFKSLVTDSESTLSYPIQRPVITIFRSHVLGVTSRGHYADLYVLDDNSTSMLYGTIFAGIPDQLLDDFEAGQAISERFKDDLAFQHEIGHMLDWPDTYQYPDMIQYHTFEADLMSGGGSPLAIHKVLSGWMPFMYMKYDSDGLVVKPQDMYEHPREAYIIWCNPNDLSEFYYFETHARYTSGLIVPHIYLEGSDYDYAPISIPSNNVSDEDWKYGDGISTRLFPYVSGEYSSESVVKPTWYDGQNADFALRRIRFLNNIEYENAFSGAIQYGADWGYGDIICDVDVGKPLYGDVNGDGIVNEGDEAMLRANMGRRVGLDTLRVPVDVNGDGMAGLARDRDGDGYIATSERIYDDNWTLVHTTGDWLDLNGDGRNDLDSDGNGQWDAIDRFLEKYGCVPWVIRNFDIPHSGNATYGRDMSRIAPTTGRYTGQVGDSDRVASARGLTIRVPSSTFEDDLYDVGAATMGGVDVRSLSVPMLILDNEGDGVIDMLDANLDGEPDLVPARLDPDGDGVVTEADGAYLGYYWGETTFEELWIPLPAPSWAE